MNITNLIYFQFCVYFLEVQVSFPGSHALTEIHVKCGKCGSIRATNRLRYHHHFKDSKYMFMCLFYFIYDIYA